MASKQLQTLQSLIPTLFILCTTNANLYDEEHALKSLHFAYAAYCDNTSLANWSCKWCSDSSLDMSSHGAGIVDTAELQAFMGYDADQGQIVLSFRGTKFYSFQDWIDDLEMSKTPYPNFNDGAAEVHYGFYKCWAELQDGGLSTMIESMFAGYPDADILITGHSLGGALAQLAALEMKQNTKYNALSTGKVNVITFGSPRWCDQTIATLYGEVIDSNWRIVNQRDVIPTAPLMAFGYHHTATMIRYHDTGDASREYTQCDGSGEDWTDSDCYYYRTSISDHLHYLNLYESCSDDDPNGTVSGRTPVDALDDLPPFESAVAVYTAAILGWILAVVFLVLWHRGKSELRKVKRIGMTQASYHAFNEQFE